MTVLDPEGITPSDLELVFRPGQRETDQNPEMSRGVRSHAGMVGYNCPGHSFITASIDGFTLETSCLLCF